MNVWADVRRQNLRELEQEDTGLKLAYTHQERHEALRLAVEAAEGRQGRG